MRKQPVMVDPHHANECKADQEREIGWPLPEKLIAKSTVGRLGNLDLKDKQRDGNGEDSVRKSLYPGCARMSYNFSPTRAGKPMLLFSSCLKIASVSRALIRAVYSISQWP